MVKMVKANVEILNKLIEQYQSRALWQEADGNEVAAAYLRGMFDALIGVRNGDFS